MQDDLFEGQMTDPTDIQRFVYAGRALFTVVSKRTGTRFTYQISRKRDKDATIRFVSALRGPNNETDYGYIGYIDTRRSGQVLFGRKGKPDAASFKALNWTLKQVCAGKMPQELEFYHSGTCGACGRTLTVPESIQSGLGPVCAGRQ